jgi:hypothetical protein
MSDALRDLCQVLYGRKETASDWLGGSNARMIVDAEKEITTLRQQVAELEARLSAYREALEACIPHIEGTIAWMETTVIDYGDSPYYTGSVELLEKIKRQALAGDTKKDTSA